MKEFEVRVEATQEMVGYVVVEAKSMEAAVALVKYQLGKGITTDEVEWGEEYIGITEVSPSEREL